MTQRAKHKYNVYKLGTYTYRIKPMERWEICNMVKQRNGKLLTDGQTN